MQNNIKSKISSIFNADSIGVETYFITGSTELDIKIFRANIIDTADIDIINLIEEFSNEKIIFNDELQILNLSEADERKNALYKYDIDVVPATIQTLKSIEASDKFDFFDFTKQDLSDIKGIVFAIGSSTNKFFVYKHNYQISILKRDSKFLGLLKEKDRLIKIEEDILKINKTFDLFLLDDSFYILNINTLEKFYGFKESLLNVATQGINKIIAADIVMQPELIRNRIDNISFSRKLIRATKNSPVLGFISAAEIIGFIKGHSFLSSKFKYSPCGEKLDLKTNISQEFFLKILSDDFLQSELTKRHYSSLAKDALESDVPKSINSKGAPIQDTASN